MKNISCIIPAYNEEKLIKNVLNAVKKAKSAGLISEIIVVSDDSTSSSTPVFTATPILSVTSLTTHSTLQRR